MQRAPAPATQPRESAHADATHARMLPRRGSPRASRRFAETPSSYPSNTTTRFALFQQTAFMQPSPQTFSPLQQIWSLASPARAGTVTGGIGAPASQQGPQKNPN
jgi:hypothetical protein